MLDLDSFPTTKIFHGLFEYHTEDVEVFWCLVTTFGDRDVFSVVPVAFDLVEQIFSQVDDLWSGIVFVLIPGQQHFSSPQFIEYFSQIKEHI